MSTWTLRGIFDNFRNSDYRGLLVVCDFGQMLAQTLEKLLQTPLIHTRFQPGGEGSRKDTLTVFNGFRRPQ